MSDMTPPGVVLLIGQIGAAVPCCYGLNAVR
jgi:hypothetical protein